MEDGVTPDGTGSAAPATPTRVEPGVNNNTESVPNNNVVLSFAALEQLLDRKIQQALASQEAAQSDTDNNEEDMDVNLTSDEEDEDTTNAVDKVIAEFVDSRLTSEQSDTKLQA